MRNRPSRRQFLATAGAAAATVPYFFSAQTRAQDSQSAATGEGLRLGCIGTGSRWRGVGSNAMEFAKCVAVCDVDAEHAEQAAAKVKDQQGHDPEIHEDYRRVLDRKDIDVVTIVTPDHWHSKIAIEAMRAGKKGKQPGAKNAHMRNFFECVESREDPISDVFTHHRALTTCHLANIAIRLGRTLRWDAQSERIVGDDDANAWQKRAQCAGYEIEV